jgi:hypothetical protein
MPEPMDHHDKMSLRKAAWRATQVYPGPVGELLQLELITWEEFGWRLDNRGLVLRVVKDIMNRPCLRGAAA